MTPCRICPTWLSFSLSFPFRDRIHDPGVILGELVRPGDHVADIGCGPGFFTIPMARMTGPEGRVFAVDIQTAMLGKVMRNSSRAHLDERIVPVRPTEGSLGLLKKMDFILAFWVVHEMPDIGAFFVRVQETLKDTATCLFVEPKVHVTASEYEESLRKAREAGLAVLPAPGIRFSRASLLRKKGTSQ